MEVCRCRFSMSQQEHLGPKVLNLAESEIVSFELTDMLIPSCINAESWNMRGISRVMVETEAW